MSRRRQDVRRRHGDLPDAASIRRRIQNVSFRPERPVRQMHRRLRTQVIIFADVERPLSSQNPRQAAGQEQTPIGYHAGDLEKHLDSQEESQETERLFDYIQTAFAWALGLLDDDPASPVDLQELTRGLARERTVSPGLANRLSLSLDESQKGQATAGENIFQHDDEGQNNEDGENGV